MKARNCNSFLSVMFAISLITWLSLIANFAVRVAVHRTPRWWRSNSLIRSKNMGTRMWFLYSIHYVNSSFSMREIETLRRWVSCLNYFGLSELLWQCKHEPLSTRFLAGSLVKTLLTQEIFVTSAVDLSV